MEIIKTDFGLRITDFDDINLALTLDCGQCFRWRQLTENAFSGVVQKKEARIIKDNGELLFLGSAKDEFLSLWYDYFDIKRDYGVILQNLKEDPLLSQAIDNYGTIRILRQEPWETLCSFIFSSCNNIARIKGIIERFCTAFGEGVGNSYSFPSPEVVAKLTVNDLECIRAGYRIPYIIDAAQKVVDGEVDFECIKELPIEKARESLMKICGVGKKVADCVLLFGFNKLDVFPVDRHIERICKTMYPTGLPECIKGYEGIAQQYMFHWQRTTTKPKKEA